MLLFTVFTLTILNSCDTLEACDCDYVTYDNGKETYRSSWDASCGDEVLSRSTFTHYDGSVTKTITQIECR